jgi:hypothetical protein
VHSCPGCERLGAYVNNLTLLIGILAPPGIRRMHRARALRRLLSFGDRVGDRNRAARHFGM